MCFFAACHFKIFLGSFLDAFLSFLCDVQYFFLTFCTDILGLTQGIKERRKMYGVQPSPWGHFEVCIFMYFCAHFGYGTLFQVLRNSKYFQDSWYYSQNVLVLLQWSLIKNILGFPCQGILEYASLMAEIHLIFSYNILCYLSVLKN